jgi:hypothetical protein
MLGPLFRRQGRDCQEKNFDLPGRSQQRHPAQSTLSKCATEQSVPFHRDFMQIPRRYEEQSPLNVARLSAGREMSRL